MRKRGKKSDPEEVSFWQSYSDMMAALLLVFVLIIAVAKFSYEQKSDTVDYLESRQAVLESQQEVLESREAAFEEVSKVADEQEATLKKQQEQLDQIVGVRTELVEKLKNEFKDSDFALSVDSETGAISFDSNILFDQDKYELKDSGKEFLDKFFPQYFKVILSDDFKSYVAEVIIEGHTDNDGSYMYNLELSQQRALAVSEYCLSDNADMFSKKQLSKIRKLVTANGRSSNDLIYKDAEKKIVDKAASRRVEIKFRLTEDEMIREMSEILGE